MRVSNPTSPPQGADLQLLVEETMRTGGQLSLSFKCMGTAPGLTAGVEPFESELIEAQAPQKVWSLLASIEDLRLNTEEACRFASTRLRSIGSRLARQLLPEGLRQRLRELSPRTSTLQIISDESWIPWELLNLEDPDPEAAPLFLAEAFALSRWKPALGDKERFQLQRLAVVSPKDSGLKNALAECASLLLRGSESHSDGLKVDRISARQPALSEALASGIHDGWHFSGHGLAHGDIPDHWSLELEAGHRLKSFDLESARGGLSRKRPFVFLNTCRSSRGGRGLTAAGGLAQAFVDAGAGALVGTTWKVDDESAARFASQLYAELETGQWLGEAVRRTRLHLKHWYPGDPTWLAYSLWGHPKALIEVAPAPRQETTKKALPTPVSRQRKQGEQRETTPTIQSPRELRGKVVDSRQPQSQTLLGESAAVIERTSRKKLWIALKVLLALTVWIVSIVLAGRSNSVVAPSESGSSDGMAVEEQSSTPPAPEETSPAPPREKGLPRAHREPALTDIPFSLDENVADDHASSSEPDDEEAVGQLTDDSVLDTGIPSSLPSAPPTEPPQEEISMSPISANKNEVGMMAPGETMAQGTAEDLVEHMVRDIMVRDIMVRDKAGNIPTEDEAQFDPSAEYPPRSKTSSPPLSPPLNQGETIELVGDAPGRSLAARASFSAVFQTAASIGTVRLIVAPDGRESITKVLFNNARPSFVIETATGRWRIHVLAVQESAQAVSLRISKEAS